MDLALLEVVEVEVVVVAAAVVVEERRERWIYKFVYVFSNLI